MSQRTTRSPRRYSGPELLEARIAPATFTVTSLLDDLSGGTLREMITAANDAPGADTILFAAGTGAILIDPIKGGFSINGPLTLKGPGVDVIKISGQDQSRIFFVDDGDVAKLSPFSLSGLSLVDGYGATNGGAILSVEPLTLKNVVVASSSAPTFGGGVYVNTKGKVSITGSQFLENSVTSNTTASGGGLFVRGDGGVNVSDSVITHNSSTFFVAGAVFASSGPKGFVTVDRTIISDNSAGTSIGGLSVEVDKGRPATVKNSTFTGNTAYQGGGLYSTGGPTIANCLFSDHITVGAGAALLVSPRDGEKMKITKTIFANNQATDPLSDAGAIKFFGDVGEAIISGCQFLHNSAGRNGGAIDFFNVKLTVTSSLFAGNTAKGGGAISAHDGAPLFVKGSTFTGNHATDLGGAIYAPDLATVNISGGSFLGNTAVNQGGAISLAGSSDLTVAGALFQGNTAKEGGALDLDGSGPTTVKSARFLHNITTVSNGGAVFIGTSGTVNIAGSLFQANASLSNGGAIYVASGTVIVKASSFLANSAVLAGNVGGGLAIVGGTVTLDKLKVIGNSAGTGGGIYNTVIGTVITASSVTGNFAFTGPNLFGI